jgi:hypothetical protein
MTTECRAFIPEPGSEIGPRSLQRRSQAERNGCAQSEEQHIGKDALIGRDMKRHSAQYAERRGGKLHRQEVQRPPGEDNPQRARHHAHHCILGKQLSDETPAGGSDS